MIDLPLFLFFIGGGIVSFFFGFFIGRVFALNDKDETKTCESYEDIINREG